ncbi:MAG: hypothetical protein ACK4J0_01985 [Candidatus Anstonellaceae archaeon]
MNKNQGQVSVEFILIVAFFLFVLVPILLIVQFTMASQQAKAQDAKIYEEFSKLKASIDAVGSIGPISKLAVNLYFPSKVKIGLNNKELSLVYNSLDGRKITFLHSSDFDIGFAPSSAQSIPSPEMELKEGKYTLIVQAFTNGKVSLTLN